VGPATCWRSSPTTSTLSASPGWSARAEPPSAKASDVREAREALQTALALRRGPPLQEFLDRDWARPVAVRLQEQHVDAIEDRIEADLAAGLHADLIDEIRDVLAANPFRERLWGQLMLALYRSGRQPDALAAYTEARHVLADGHGLDPGPELAHLEQAILTHDRVASPRPASPNGRSGNLPASRVGALHPAARPPGWSTERRHSLQVLVDQRHDDPALTDGCRDPFH
jgi:hypothetical protein